MRDRFITELTQEIALEPLYAEAFTNVDRGDFIPTFFVADEKHDRRWPIEWTRYSSADADVGPWAQHAYSPTSALVTKFDEAGVPLISSTDPLVMAVMIKELRPRPGRKILEIGAGTGYNAAVLSEIVGDGGIVTSIDIDQEACTSAARRLGSRANVRVAHGDGRRGFAENAPYDGIIVTGNAARLEGAWLGQLARNGRLVVHLKSAMLSGIFVGTAVGDRTVRGRFIEFPEIGFIPLRGFSETPTAGRLPIGELGDRLADGLLSPGAAEALLDDTRDAVAYMGLLAEPDRYEFFEIGRPGDWYRGAVIDQGPQRCEVREVAQSPGGKRVALAGDRSLLTALSDAYQSWIDAGSPKYGKLEFTITDESVRAQANGGTSTRTSLFAPSRVLR